MTSEPHQDYIDFLKQKIPLAQFDGFDIDEREIHPMLKPHQKACVKWAVKGGNRALFESFGLGKTLQQIEIVRLTQKRSGGRALIVCPLGVRQEFKRDGLKVGVEFQFVRRGDEMGDGAFFLTNYESIRDGRLDPSLFTVVSLDEASVLRSYGSKTYQEFLPLFAGVKHKFVATATPSPNRYKELIHYAGFLGIMDTGQALTRFFQRDSTQANNLTLYPHKEKEFWLWLNSWAIFLQRPSDLGYSDEGYDLPDLQVHYHEVKTEILSGGFEKDGQGIMFKDAALGLKEAATEKRDSLSNRIANMTEIIKEHGLNTLSLSSILARTIGVERIEVKGDLFTVANNDCVVEARMQPDDHVDLMVTSIPFANHYEYTPSYNDFGHTENNDHFWKQMDFLTPELLRILKPGRMYCCHVKDRILFGNVTGAGAPTVSPFHCEAIMHGKKHGFDYMGMITVVTDVVRENNQTYRLGWSEQCKDGSKMGVGSPEYILLFRKPQTDRTRGYADLPVKKNKADYTRAQWQVDAHAFWRSSGNRLLTAEDLTGMGPDKLAKAFTEYSLQHVYDYEHHVRIGKDLDARGALPSTFMSLAPGSHHQDVWHDVNRMLTLNGQQTQRGLQNHVCPLQIDIVDRLINRYSNKGELVYDPFCGLGTVPYRAIKLGRKGQGSELNTEYFFDSVQYLNAMEREVSMPTLFDALELEAA